MATTFRLLRRRCGLSKVEAASYLAVAEQTIELWDTSHQVAPVHAIHHLRQLYRNLEQAAEEYIRRARQRAPAGAMLELGLASDDEEALQFGVPCVGAHEALLRLVAARLNRNVRVVPAGSTVATAAAMDDER